MARHAELSEVDERDSLLAVQIARLPVANPSLRKARLVKNVRLESVIELYSDGAAGRGHIDLGDAHMSFGLASPADPDLLLLRNVATLPAFDAFSLRLLLRDCGAQPEDLAKLELSPERQQAVERELTAFTRPLLRYVYARDDVENVSLADLFALFRAPDVEFAEKQLERLARKLEIKVLHLPRFLEDYADTFMAIALYRLSLHRLRSAVEQFLAAVKHLCDDVQYRQNRTFKAFCADIDRSFRAVLETTVKRIGAAERMAEKIWATDTVTPLRDLQTRLREFHALIGLLVAGLSAKMTEWHAAFPVPESGKPKDRAELLSNDMKYAVSVLKTAAARGLREAQAAEDWSMRPLSANEMQALRSYLRRRAH